MDVDARRTIGLAVGLALAACQPTNGASSKADDGAEATPASEAEAEAAPTTGAITLDMPYGVAATVDRRPVTAPGQTIADVDPGAHTVRFEPPCGEVIEQTVQVKAGETRIVRPEPPIPTAELTVKVTTPDGPPKALQLRISEVPVADEKTSKVVACPDVPLRLKVSAEGWGGYWEDLRLEPGQAFTRAVELARGPDLVRIEGGKFTLGPPERLVDEWYDWIPRVPVEIDTFDIDRTEVTAAQLHECHVAGGCPRDRGLWGITTKVLQEFRPLCTTDVFDEQRAPTLRRDDPANCVARWEAEQYCEWAGKQLPTPAQWEYAARSRKEDYACPWGREGEYSKCGAPQGATSDPQRRQTTEPVCTATAGVSEQGVCDLMWGLQEYVVKPPGLGLRGQQRGELGARAAFEYEKYDDPNPRRQEHSLGVGFRCVRPVAK
jgi:formylglycine-generating enzyme required for sulfatase activity